MIEDSYDLVVSALPRKQQRLPDWPGLKVPSRRSAPGLPSWAASAPTGGAVSFTSAKDAAGPIFGGSDIHLSGTCPVDAVKLDGISSAFFAGGGGNSSTWFWTSAGSPSATRPGGRG